MIFLRFAIHVEHYNRLFLGNAKESGEELPFLPPSLPDARCIPYVARSPRARAPFACVRPRIHLPANDAGESVENDHKSLTSESFCLHAVSVPFFLSCPPTNRACVVCARLRSPVFTVTIYSRSSKTPCRRTIRSITPARTLARSLYLSAVRTFFIRYFIVMIMRAYVYLYGCPCCVSREEEEEEKKARLIAVTSNRAFRRLCRPFFSI